MKKLILIMLIAVVMVACGKKEVKQASPESKLTQEAFTLTETIRAAFVKRDTDTLRKNSTEEGFSAITANTRTYDSVDLIFTPRWADIDGDKVSLNVSWKSEWKVSGSFVSDRGMTVFLLAGKPLKVVKILQANPFILSGK